MIDFHYKYFKIVESHWIFKKSLNWKFINWTILIKLDCRINRHRNVEYLKEKKIKKSKNLNINDIARRINILKKLQQFCFSKNFQFYLNNMKDTLKNNVHYLFIILIEQINASFIVFSCHMIFVFLKKQINSIIQFQWT